MLHLYYMFKLSQHIFLLVCILVSITTSTVSAQNKDSLERAAASAPADTTKLYLLVYLSNICDAIEIKKFAEPALTLSDELLKQHKEPGIIRERTLRHKALALSNLGYLYDIQGQVGTALDYYKKSLTIYESLGETKYAAYVLSNMAYTYTHQGDIERATDYYNKALQALLKLGDKAGAAGTIHNIGGIYLTNGDLKKAKQYYTRSLSLHEEVKNNRGIVGTLNNLCNIMVRNGETQQALAATKRSLSLINTFDDKFVKVSTYNSAAAVYMTDKKYPLSLRYLDTALALAKEFGFPELIRNTEDQFSKVYAKLNDHKNSLEHYKQYIIFKDSLSNDESRRLSIKNQFKFDFEQKETELKEKQDRERQESESKARSQRIIIYCAIAGLVMMVIFALFIFRSLQKKKKANKIITEQKQLVEEKSTIIEEKHKEITDSITYAERIQRALLANKKILDKHLNDYFILFKPKDIVSGDFYWATHVPSNEIENKEYFYLAVADSTGHGVPGAIMSILNIACLDKAITKGITSPDLILNETRSLIIEHLKNDGSTDGGKDGMDGSLLRFDFKNNMLYCALANNPVWIMRQNQLIEIKADRMPIGKHHTDQVAFSLHEVPLQKGDVIYVLTDGYPDQFGGLGGKKFKSKQLQSLIQAISTEPMAVQKQKLNDAFETWKGNLEQIDDVCILGIRV